MGRMRDYVQQLQDLDISDSNLALTDNSGRYNHVVCITCINVIRLLLFLKPPSIFYSVWGRSEVRINLPPLRFVRRQTPTTPCEERGLAHPIQCIEARSAL